MDQKLWILVTKVTIMALKQDLYAHGYTKGPKRFGFEFCYNTTQVYPQCDDNQISHACPIYIYYALYTSCNIDA